jgi:hypothetical protein
MLTKPASLPGASISINAIDTDAISARLSLLALTRAGHRERYAS